jgi:hypothetical protein
VLAAKTRDRLAAILFGMFGSNAAPVRVESVSQAAAGGLLLSIAIAELVLSFWEAGWHHRAVGLSMAGAGLAFLTCGIAEIATAARRSSPSRQSNGID